MSFKLKSHWNWQFYKYTLSLKLKCYLIFFTHTEETLKHICNLYWNITKTKMLLKQKFHKKVKCHKTSIDWIVWIYRIEWIYPIEWVYQLHPIGRFIHYIFNRLIRMIFPAEVVFDKEPNKCIHRSTFNLVLISYNFKLCMEWNVILGRKGGGLDQIHKILDLFFPNLWWIMTKKWPKVQKNEPTEKCRKTSKNPEGGGSDLVWKIPKLKISK